MTESAIIDLELQVPLAPTQEAFVESTAPIVALIGPEGEGKTYAGFAAVLRHAQAHIDDDLPVRCALIRDTHENIKTKTRTSIDKAIAAIARLNNMPEFVSEFRWMNDSKILRCDSLGLIIDLFGADDNASVAKLQGGDMWSFIWLEEPAPMYAGNNAGMPKAVFDAALSRAARGIGTSGNMRLQITMNPADEDHWTFETLVKSPYKKGNSEFPEIYTETFHIPYGENPTRTDLQRQATKAAYKNDAALYARLVQGKFAFVQIGVAVTPEYRDHHHFVRPGVPWDLRVVPGAVGFRGWDGGHNPTCVIGQIAPQGGLNFIHAFVLPHAGMRQLIEQIVLPCINLHYREVKEWIDTGDPTLETGDQGDITKSAAHQINTLLNAQFQGASHWPAPREAMKNALTKIYDVPYVRVGKHAEALHKALRGGWHFERLKSGQVLKDKPVKDHHSHPGDCFGAICLKLLGHQQKEKRPPRKAVNTRIYG